MTPYTSNALMAAGVSPMPMEEAAHRAFEAVGEHDGKLVRSALYSSDATTQKFWDEFVQAHRALHRKEAA